MSISLHTDFILSLDIADTSCRCGLAVVQPNSEERRNTAIACLRSKKPVALLGITDDSEDFISFASMTAHRNHVPLIVLGSWRFIPAAAALKEIVSSNVLGTLVSISATPVNGFADNAFLNDLIKWLCDGIPVTQDDCLPAYDVRIAVTGTAGTAVADFSLDGQDAMLHLNILGKQRERLLPKANPLASELAVLSLCMKENTRLKKLPLLMTC